MIELVAKIKVAFIKSIEKWYRVSILLTHKRKIDYQVEFKKIALICTNPLGLGDLVMSTPFIRSMRAGFPDAEIHLITDKDLYDHLAGVDKIIYLKGGILELSSQFTQLAVHRYDLGIVMERAVNQSNYVNNLKPRFKLGYLGGFKILSDFSLVKEGLFFNKKEHFSNMSLKIAEALGIKRYEEPITPDYSDEVKHKVNSLLSSLQLDVTKKTIALNPFVQWESRRWHEDNYIELVRRLYERFNFVLTGGKDSVEINAKIEQTLSAEGMRIVNLSGKLNLKENAVFLSHCDLMVTADCGPMHFAFMMHCPTLAFFGPIVPEHRLPFGYREKGIIDSIALSDYHKVSYYNYESKHYDATLNGLHAIPIDDVIERIEFFFANGRFSYRAKGNVN